MQSVFPVFALLKTTSAYESSLHLIFKNIQKESSTNTVFSNSSQSKMIHDLTFCHPVIITPSHAVIQSWEAGGSVLTPIYHCHRAVRLGLPNRVG